MSALPLLGKALPYVSPIYGLWTLFNGGKTPSDQASAAVIARYDKIRELHDNNVRRLSALQRKANTLGPQMPGETRREIGQLAGRINTRGAALDRIEDAIRDALRRAVELGLVRPDQVGADWGLAGFALPIAVVVIVIGLMASGVSYARSLAEIEKDERVEVARLASVERVVNRVVESGQPVPAGFLAPPAKTINNKPLLSFDGGAVSSTVLIVGAGVALFLLTRRPGR